MKTQNILDLIGNTPLIELSHYSPSSKVRIFAKLEGNNPGGSIKDRVAKYLMMDAEEKGLVKKSNTIIEATSGNTGIGLAMVSSVLGYKFVAVMPESASLERRKILKQFGAEIILTDGKKGTNYSFEVARKLLNNDPGKYVMLNQYENNSNVLAHYETTASEIIEQLPTVTHFVTGLGTGGTITGTGTRLKQYKQEIQVMGVEPKENSRIQGLRNMKKYSPPIFNKEILDKNIMIENDEEVFKLARELPMKEGISVGISSGASLWGALQIANNIKEGNIVTIFPDRADRYVSTELFN
ncbi:cysteine synthase [Candidatus Dojkabacteria bacterium]|nr:cysteine synthase [Candidatus Dojkabacteria bacterium]